LELLVAEFLCWILGLEIGEVRRKRDFNRCGACILNNDFESWLVADLIMRAIERQQCCAQSAGIVGLIGALSHLLSAAAVWAWRSWLRASKTKAYLNLG
jgi:hypothetical protein